MVHRKRRPKYCYGPHEHEGAARTTCQCTKRFDILHGLLPDNKKPAGRACICESQNVTWEDGELLREKGHFRESTTEQQMPFVSSRILQSDICYGLFHTRWPSSLLRKEKERDKEEYVSSLFPRPSSLVNAQDFFLSLFHGMVMPTNHPCHPTPISWNITKDHS